MSQLHVRTLYIPRQGSGTISPLTLLYDNILRYLDGKSGVVRLLSVHFSKVFDKFPFQTILRSCIDGRLLTQFINWLYSYLNGRRQCVSLPNSISSWHSLPSGVPQGSKIGPLLFSITSSTLHPRHNNSRMIKYVDDVSLLHFLRSFNDGLLHNEFDHIRCWSQNASLELNFSKCSVTNFITRKTFSCPPVLYSDWEVFPIINEVKTSSVTFSHTFFC